MDNYPRRPFLLFATLFEATMIDKQLENKPIYFELSMGWLINALSQLICNSILLCCLKAST
jgi:hypothetical protein